MVVGGGDGEEENQVDEYGAGGDEAGFDGVLGEILESGVGGGEVGSATSIE